MKLFGQLKYSCFVSSSQRFNLFAPKASFDEEQERRGKRSGTKGLELATLSLDDTGHLTREHDDAGSYQAGENDSIGGGVH